MVKIKPGSRRNVRLKSVPTHVHSTTTIIHKFRIDINSIHHRPLWIHCQHACLSAHSPHSHTRLPRTFLSIELRHQVSLAGHTESPPPSPADSLLSPRCHLTQAQFSPWLTTQPAQPPEIERSIRTLPPFRVDIDSSSIILRCARNLILYI